MIHLHSPWFLLLLLPLTAAAVTAYLRRPPSLSVSTAAHYAGAGRPLSWHHPLRWPLYLKVLALGLMLVALARPQSGIEKTVERTEGIDIMLVLDVSGSMIVYDPPGDMTSLNDVARAVGEERLRNRIGIAKEALAEFVRKRPHDRVGLVAFAKLPYIVCPPTLDHDFLLNHLSTLDANMFGADGTGIASALGSATSRLKDSPAKRRVAVLFTDGENTVDAPITPEQAARLAAEFDVVVYTVGIGSDRAVAPVQTLLGSRLQFVQTKLDEALLKKIASLTGGRYLAARDQRGFQLVMDEIDKLEKVDLEAPRYMDYSERFFPWLIAGLAVMLLAVFLENTVLLRAP